MGVAPLKIFLRPEKRFVSEARPTELLILARIVPAPIPSPSSRRVGVVVDRSLARDPDTLAALGRALRRACEHLEPHDVLTIVAAGDHAERMLHSTKVRDLGDVEALLSTMQPCDAPVTWAGWLAAGVELADDWDRDAVNRLVVVTGTRTIGPSPEVASVVRAARGLFRRGISTSTIGVGHDFDEDLLVPFAVEGGGNAWFAERVEELAPILDAEMRALGGIYTEWATLRFDLEGADVVDVLNDLPWVAENKIALPPLVAEAPFHVVARLRLRPGEAGHDMSPVTLRIKNLDLGCRNATVHRKAMKVHVVSSALADSMEPDIAVQAHAARLQLARSHARCITHLDADDAPAARELLDFALSRFQSLSGQSGSTLLTRDLATLMRARERILDPGARQLVRKLFRYAAVGALRSDLIGGQAFGA